MNEKNNELLTRGISSIYPSREFVQEKLNKGEKTNVIFGY